MRRIDDRRAATEKMQAGARERREAGARRGRDARTIWMERVTAGRWDAVKEVPWSISANRGGWEITEPNQLFGGGRGAGLGYSASAAVGATLGLKDGSRVCINIIGDGDLL